MGGCSVTTVHFVGKEDLRFEKSRAKERDDEVGIICITVDSDGEPVEVRKDLIEVHGLNGMHKGVYFPDSESIVKPFDKSGVEMKPLPRLSSKSSDPRLSSHELECDP